MRSSLQQITWLNAIHTTTTVLHNKKRTKYLAEISPHNLEQGFYPERGVGTYWGYSVEIMEMRSYSKKIIEPTMCQQVVHKTKGLYPV